MLSNPPHFRFKCINEGWVCSSVVEHLPGIRMVPGIIPSIGRGKPT